MKHIAPKTIGFEIAILYVKTPDPARGMGSNYMRVDI